MKIITISDTHTKHKQIPLEWLEPADMIIHAGDISGMGHLTEIQNFCDWFSRLDQYKHKIFIAGNHDWGFERNPNDVDLIIKKYPNITYLQDSSVEIDGIKIYGTPHTPTFFDWAFNVDRGENIKQYWDKIPKDVDILITHGPPYGLGDWVVPRKNHSGEFRKFVDGGNVGCEDLLDTIRGLPNLKFNIFGHIHSGHTYEPIVQNGVSFINASLLNEQYYVTYPPIIFEI
jgi:Icc-related predicted phosphoesterase